MIRLAGGARDFPIEPRHPFFRGLLIGGAICLVLWGGGFVVFFFIVAGGWPLWEGRGAHEPELVTP
jgi:hypothetical protein